MWSKHLAKHCLPDERSRKFNATYNYYILSAALNSFSSQQIVCAQLCMWLCVCMFMCACVYKCIKDFCCSLDPLQQSTNYRVGSSPVGIYYSSFICSLCRKVPRCCRCKVRIVWMNLRERRWAISSTGVSFRRGQLHSAWLGSHIKFACFLATMKHF